mmetsp:Transcript_40632/g.95488  ORF Transcript_40632/g.95488 Transcript_40632/m.95488 type:complete len:214 (-) Transcript_40632:661-1302(-)
MAAMGVVVRLQQRPLRASAVPRCRVPKKRRTREEVEHAVFGAGQHSGRAFADARGRSHRAALRGRLRERMHHAITQAAQTAHGVLGEECKRCSCAAGRWLRHGSAHRRRQHVCPTELHGVACDRAPPVEEVRRQERLELTNEVNLPLRSQAPRIIHCRVEKPCHFQSRLDGSLQFGSGHLLHSWKGRARQPSAATGGATTWLHEGGQCSTKCH